MARKKSEFTRGHVLVRVRPELSVVTHDIQMYVPGYTHPCGLSVAKMAVYRRHRRRSNGYRVWGPPRAWFVRHTQWQVIHSESGYFLRKCLGSLERAKTVLNELKDIKDWNELGDDKQQVQQAIEWARKVTVLMACHPNNWRAELVRRTLEGKMSV